MKSYFNNNLLSCYNIMYDRISILIKVRYIVWKWEKTKRIKKRTLIKHIDLWYIKYNKKLNIEQFINTVPLNWSKLKKLFKDYYRLGYNN